MAKSTCRACGEVFKSISAFDKHRIGSYGEPIYKNGNPETKKVLGYTKPTRRCMTKEEMLQAGMLQNDKGLWVSSAYDPKAHGEEDEQESEE